MTIRDAAELAGAVVAIIAACYALARVSGSLWRGFAKLQAAVSHVELVPVIHEKVETLAEVVAPIPAQLGRISAEQERVDGELQAHVQREEILDAARDEANVKRDERHDLADERLGRMEERIKTIDESLVKIAGWHPAAET